MPVQGELRRVRAQNCSPNGEGKRAIGILYGVREENVAFLEFSRHFRRHGLPVPEIYAEDLEHGAPIWKRILATPRSSNSSPRIAVAKLSPQVIDAYRKVVAISAAVSDRSRSRSELHRLLSARRLLTGNPFLGI